MVCCSPWGCRVRLDLATEQKQKQSLKFKWNHNMFCLKSTPLDYYFHCSLLLLYDYNMISFSMLFLMNT